MEDHLNHYQWVYTISSSNEEDSQAPVHQLLEAPRQLPLPSVRELESNVVVQQKGNDGSNEILQPSLSQSSQHVDNIESLQERRLVLDPQQVMSSPNQAIPIQPQEVDMFNVPNLPFSQTQRNEIFSETSSRIYS